jgi:tripartite-type tricarboxylate transporter receptor subunit TctC
VKFFFETDGMVSRAALAGVAAACCLAASTAATAAQEFPDRPVRVIVPFPPFGSVDVVLRLIQPALAQRLGQSVVIDNRPGASGNIGAEAVAHSAPDGYTLLATTLPLVVNPGLFRRLPYDVARDFAPVSQLAAAPFVLTVHPTLPVSTVKEFIAYARVRPGELNYASTGSGSDPHVAAELFKSLAKLDMTHVPYKAGGPALASLLSRETQFAFLDVKVVSALAKAGRLRALGVTSAKRSPVVPDVPTIAESGLRGYEFTSWYGVLAPHGIPAERVVALNGHIRNTLRTPEMTERLAREGIEVVASTPDEFGKFLRVELAKWAKVVKEAGLKAD